NAQVALYQAGEVDYLVATDAIGMGLNMDVDHVAFAALRKFDGRGPRDLRPAELAQIAGHASDLAQVIRQQMPSIAICTLFGMCIVRHAIFFCLKIQLHNEQSIDVLCSRMITTHFKPETSAIHYNGLLIYS
ncbi:MAG: hypothetical protein HOC20_01010, partial [Chloroflexi bacterium]|nr:hypothetical protein [Chloroflexota bacterium]